MADIACVIFYVCLITYQQAVVIVLHIIGIFAADISEFIHGPFIFNGACQAVLGVDGFTVRVLDITKCALGAGNLCHAALFFFYRLAKLIVTILYFIVCL